MKSDVEVTLVGGSNVTGSIFVLSRASVVRKKSFGLTVAN